MAYRSHSIDVNLCDMKSGRGYRMTRRAIMAAQTADDILRATKELLMVKPVADITLADIASSSGVTVQTVLRRYGDKESLFAAGVTHFAQEVRSQRGRAVPNTIDSLVANLDEHYEDWGPLMLKLRAEQAGVAAIRDAVATGKQYHRGWCETVFSDTLAAVPERDRVRRLAELIAICDLGTWELLRLDSGLGRNEYRKALCEMLKPLSKSA
jgi:AcrR family transcriptional regulator